MAAENLLARLATKQNWIKKRYDYYEQKHLRPDPSPIIQMRDSWVYNSTLGWCTEAVDSLLNKLRFEGFENDEYMFWDIFKQNNKDIFFKSAMKSALISGCGFVYISSDEDGNTRLQVIDGANATGRIDPITNLLTEGVAVLDTDERNNPSLVAHFEADKTTIYEYQNKTKSEVSHKAGYPLLVPIIYRPDAKRPFGQPRISRAAMDLMDKARYSITRAEITGEFGSIPQKYVLGLSPDAEFDTVKNAYKEIIAIDKDEDGDKPTVGQFQQMTNTPHLNQFAMYKDEFLREMGMDSKESMQEIAEDAQAMFGSSFLNVGFVASCLQNEQKLNRARIADVEPLWAPAYNIDMSAVSALGDGILKINQAFPDALGEKAIHKLTGLPIGDEN